MTMRFSTNDVAASDKFAYWREAVCDSYVQLVCDSDSHTEFEGEILLDRWSRLSTSFVSGSNQTVERRRSDIARSNEASFLISLQCKKNGTVCQRGNTALLEPGDFALYSSIDPYLIKIPDGFSQLVLQIPRDTLLQRLPNADLLTGRRVAGTGELSALVNNNILNFTLNLAQANPKAQQCLQDTIVDLIATGLATLDHSKVELAKPAQNLMIRANAYINENIADPDLDRNNLANALGISLRRLSELFKLEGITIAAHIRQLRLQRIALDLADPRYQSQPISEIAMRWGIQNFQHFSTTFKRQFGASPRDYRLNTQGDQPTHSQQT